MAGLLIMPALLFAQFNNNTTSPYSRFGLGDLHSYSFGRTAAMGGASLASRNNQQINMSNPASYTAVDSLGFMFEFGVNGKFANYSNDITSMNANDVNFGYFAMNFQITNWLGTSMGLTPYSDVGYDVNITDEIENAGKILYQYTGGGSLSKAYFGLAVNPVKNISVGANLNYMFGLLSRTGQTYFLESSSFYKNQRNETLRIRDFNLNFGIQGTIPIKSDQRVTLGAVIENKPKYTGFYSDLNTKYISIPLGSNNYASDLDTISNVNEDNINIQFPLTYGFGISYVKDNQLEINADYYHQSWSDVNLPGGGNDVLTDLNKFAVGAEWIPDRFSIRSYLSRIAYRAGLKYENTYLLIDNQQINDFGISFGVGLPVYRSNSTINVSAELGRRGTKKDNLILENYAKLNLSVNLYDLWFIKRRFD